MKRDIELIRAILCFMEDQPEGRNINWRVEIDGYTKEQIGFHCRLMAQAGLIEASDTTSMSDHTPTARPNSILWAGYEFLEASRDPTLWQKAKDKVIVPAGGVALSVLVDWLKQEAKARLGIP